MHVVDGVIFVLYALCVLGVGFFFSKKNESVEDYYLGGKEIESWHIGMSVVATDVGGGFSVGLGGLGFTMGLSGSWILFTGLLGAWLSAVVLIPRIKRLEQERNFLTFPQIFHHFYGRRAALLAGLISVIGYLGFTSSQILAGAKLASASMNGVSLETALWVIGLIIVFYTALGGLKAVVYTDTVQWLILMLGLFFVAMPVLYHQVGGWTQIRSTLPDAFFSLSNISLATFFNWMVAMVPMWFVAMTLYQRIYACRTEKEARRAWFLAGLLEWPLMALMGTLLGMLARVAYEQGAFAELGFAAGSTIDSELGVPLILRTGLPLGVTGLILAAYFSAIMSTADSCLMAASGNFVTDLVGQFFPMESNPKKFLRFSQLATWILGILALVLASTMNNVLNLMLHSYAFMVSGLCVPTLAALFFRKRSSMAAIGAMGVGGTTTVILASLQRPLWGGLDANFYGIAASAGVYMILSGVDRKRSLGVR